MENKPASLLVVSLGKTLNGMPPPLCGRQVAQTHRIRNSNSQASADVPSKIKRYYFLSRKWRINTANKKKRVKARIRISSHVLSRWLRDEITVGRNYWQPVQFLRLQTIFAASLVDTQLEKNSVEKKPASSLVVTMGKALNGISSPAHGG